MTLFESPDPWQSASPQRPPERRAGHRASRVIFLVSAALALAFFGSFYLDELPLPVRSWVAETIPGGRGLVGIPPDPGQEVAALADRMFLTEEGRLVFYQAQPRIADAAEIEQACSDGPALPDDFFHAGCYLGLGRIYILRDDASMVTTAAHELLHAAYSDFDASTRAHVDALVTAEMLRVPAGDPVHEQIAASVGGATSAWPDEQFAYLGSQVALDGGFAPELEAVYAQFFTDRRALVDVFLSR